MRNLADAGFHLFETQKFHKLGDHGIFHDAVLLLAGLVLLGLPIPSIFGWYGREFREWKATGTVTRVTVTIVHVEGDEAGEGDEVGN